MKQTSLSSHRISTIDYMRGLVIVIMAIDHIRDFVGVRDLVQAPMADDASLAIYLTRLVTHLCAPAFVFLAGTSAGLMGERKSSNQVAYLLATRGIWLILIDLVLVSTLWMFSLPGSESPMGRLAMIFGVIGAIGFSMLCLSVLQYLGARLCLVLGLAIVLGHNALDPIWPTVEWRQEAPVWVALLRSMFVMTSAIDVAISYPPLPWVGIMLLGFGTAGLFTLPANRRDRQLLIAGIVMLILFAILRGTQIYGDTNLWQQKASIALTLRDFFDVSKYPPSLLFTLLTLGICALLMASARFVPNPIYRVLTVYGKAPFAFYLAHLFVIHSAAVLLGVYQGFEAKQFFIIYFAFPDGYGVGLLGIYLFWVAITAALYPLCKWVANVKAKRSDWWLSYL